MPVQFSSCHLEGATPEPPLSFPGGPSKRSSSRWKSLISKPTRSYRARARSFSGRTLSTITLEPRAAAQAREALISEVPTPWPVKSGATATR